jgi:predicted dehydrogenase
VATPADSLGSGGQVLRAAVLGCGAIGAGRPAPHPDVGVDSHAAAYDACRDTELIAVCDVDRALAEDCARRFGVPAVHTDPAALLAERPEIVSVCTPDATHAELVESALLAPGVRAVLAEKPLALDAGAAFALAELARERGVVLAVAYFRRFAPALRALRDELAAGAIGELQHVAGVYVKGLKHNGTHWLDLLRFLAGEPIEVRGWDRLAEGGDDPTLDAELKLADGVGARLAGLDTTAFTAFEMDLVGTRGRIRLAEAGHVIERWEVADDARYPGYRALRAGQAEGGALRDALLHAVADVVQSLRDGTDPACTGEDGAVALALAGAIRASAAIDGGRMAVWSADR